MNFDGLIRHIANIPGWRTKRKILVFESDDWGSVRMPSLDVFQRLQKMGVNVASGDNERFNTLDTLESGRDFEMLFSTLEKHQDKNGNYPVITAMSLCANPDFDKIKDSGFSQYFYESVTQTLARYNHADASTYWQQGAISKLFIPEFHGREHLNIKVWMDDLRAGNEHTLAAFSLRFWGFRNKNSSGVSYQAAFDIDRKETIDLQREVAFSGLQLFEKIYGRPARYFVPPNGAICQEVVDAVASRGVKYICTPKIQNEPQGAQQTKKRFRYLGMKGKYGVTYLTRNCFFEPSYRGKGFSVNDCLEQISSSFAFNKPAVISSHRVNYVGGLSEKNRKDGNAALHTLLTECLRRWPSIEFMTSAELGDLIRNDQK